ncbi:MAG: primosomal protein N' [Lachnospiraceae bacterium]|nr:primosomal protein N' [Lachnospiraceae bacterium]
MSADYADIIVDISHEKLDRPFQYRIPDRLKDRIDVGCCVVVPFGGANRRLKGYVVALSDKCNFDEDKIKDIEDIAAKAVDIEDRMIALAAFIKKNYGGTMIQALKTVLPAKKSVKRLESRYVKLIIGREEAISLLGECERKHRTAQARLLREIIDREELPYEQAVGRLGVSASAIKSLENSGVIKTVSDFSYRKPVKAPQGSSENVEGDKARGAVFGVSEIKLSAGQQYIIDEFVKELDAGTRTNYLIHGITGSGKTEVYIRLIEEVVKRGEQAIVLIPEIALTRQTVQRFCKSFGDRVSIMNSMLSAGEKYDQCERAKNGGIDVIIGPRSALFTPFRRLGLIIIDEEHENSYKSESTPRYHAREVALEAARLNNASVVMGSATPSVESYYRAQKGSFRLFKLNERLTGGELPKVYTVDMREELRSGNRSVFSAKLQELMADRLSKGQQSMLFLNRRGYAGFISCRSCGEVIKCPHCDVSLSEHRGGRLKCHYCGYETVKPLLCPKCGSKYIFGLRAGTQQIEDKLKGLFPGVRTLRMDGDTTRTRDSYERILSAFSEGEADVLIGTQMIVKGHDFPNVTLVGVLAADLSLGGGDYRCGERTFELLTQAVGRAGRGKLPGEAVIQTYQPEHYAVVHAARQDYEGFYEEELLYRELSGYPPAAHMLAVQIYGKNEDNAKQLANRLAYVVKCDKKYIGDCEGVAAVIGPAPASIEKVNDVYRFVFYIKNARYDLLVSAKDRLESELKAVNPAEVVQFDFDPMNIL